MLIIPVLPESSKPAKSACSAPRPQNQARRISTPINRKTWKELLFLAPKQFTIPKNTAKPAAIGPSSNLREEQMQIGPHANEREGRSEHQRNPRPKSSDRPNQRTHAAIEEVVDAASLRHRRPRPRPRSCKPREEEESRTERGARRERIDVP